jgi:hypothetical protein
MLSLSGLTHSKNPGSGYKVSDVYGGNPVHITYYLTTTKTRRVLQSDFYLKPENFAKILSEKANFENPSGLILAICVSPGEVCDGCHAYC